MNASDDPIREFQALLQRAQKSEPEPTAVAVATADSAGRPAVRMLLLKVVDERGLVIFTNYDSRKGRELSANPHAALCFFWKSIETQVRVEGPVERVSAAESDAYFASRPRGSRLGAWVSLQSQPLESREVLEQRLAQVETTFGKEEADGPVPRPPHWGGLRVRPVRFEFWFGHHFRLHDRFEFTRPPQSTGAPADPWQFQRLYP